MAGVSWDDTGVRDRSPSSVSWDVLCHPPPPPLPPTAHSQSINLIVMVDKIHYVIYPTNTKHQTPTSAGPAAQMVGQHWPSIWPMSGVFWSVLPLIA